MKSMRQIDADARQDGEEQGGINAPGGDTTHAEEQADAERRSAPSGRVIYRAVLKEADEELVRPSAALFWSGLAAGLSMGFSLIAEALLRHHLPDEPWRVLVSKLGYSVGFLVVILGRQQLFTENTLTPVLPLLLRKNLSTLKSVARLWCVTLTANLMGAALVSLVCMRTPAFEADIRAAFAEIGHEAMEPGFLATMIRGIFAGWLIALIVWMLPYAGSSRFFVILVLTWLVGVGHFSHIIAGAVTTTGLAWIGEAGWGEVAGTYLVPTLMGNIIGGVMLVAGLNHAQVVAGEAENQT